MDLLRFELLYHWRRPSFWLISLVFGFFGFMDMVSNASQGNAYFYVNSPSQIFQITIWYSLFSVLAATAFVAETLVRDVRHGMEPLVLATPISKWSYLSIRFFAALLITVMSFSAYLPGMIIASLMPGMNPYAIGPLRLDAYGLSFLMITLPNLIWVSVFAFFLASRFRNLIVVYVGAIVLVMLYITAMLLVGVEQLDYERLRWWALLDPYGYFALESATLTWTVHQHNHQMPTLDETFVFNRSLWLALALLLWWLGYQLFDMRPKQSRAKVKPHVRATGKEPSASQAESELPTSVALTQGSSTSLQQGLELSVKQPGLANKLHCLVSICGFELRFILRSRAFQILLFCGLVSLLFAASGSRSFEFSNPSTDILIHTANLYFNYVMFAIVVFYAAELRWRDTEAGIQAVIDAMSIGNWPLVLGKLLALFLVIGLNLLLAQWVLVLYQVIQGYYQFELGLSSLMLFGVHGPYYLILAALALFCQALVRQKYAAMLLTVLVALSPIPLDAFGLYHNLFQFGDTNDLGYSPMNGYGDLLTGHWWYLAYWSAIAVVLVMLTIIFWPRGSWSLPAQWQPGQRGRFIPVGIALVVVGILAGWIWRNTTVLNPYQPPGKDRLAVYHEKNFKQYEQLPMPVVVATELTADLYPHEGRFIGNGRYQLENRTQQPIEQIHLSTFLNLELVEAQIPGARLTESHPDWGYYIYQLDEPMEPGDRLAISFVTRTQVNPGFRNQSDADDVYLVAPNTVIGNGSSLYSPFILPFIGYTKMVEHKEAWLRQKYGLPPLDSRMRPHDDAQGLARALTVSHLTWSTTDLTLSTAGDQQLVTSGELIKHWQQEGRNYYHYQSEGLNRGKFTLFSGRFSQATDRSARVPVHAYYHQPHEVNVPSMLQHLAQSLTLYESAFGPYPFAEVRLVEFAYYPGMVFSEAGTIGLPEVLGWKADLNAGGEDAVVGWLSYLLAHSWWEDQLIAADVAGGMSIRESLSGYATNLYRRQIYSPEKFRQLKSQQMRDYFRALGQVDFVEPPLDDVYNEVLPARFKGHMVLEQVESQIGQPALLTAIRNFLQRYRGQYEPYASFPDLVSAIVEQTPEDLRGRVRELFTEVVTYRFEVLKAEYLPIAKGTAEAQRFAVTLDLEARKLYTRDLGEQRSALLDWPLRILIKDAQGEVLYDQQLLLAQELDSLQLELTGKPHSVQLDPDLVLPSPQPGGKTVRVRLAPE